MDRTHLARLLFVVPLLAAGIALGAPRPAAAAFSCTTDIFGGTIKESVVVPAGASCGLSGVTVRGGVTVAPGGAFGAGQGTEIRGSVTATAPGDFQLSGVVVRGGVTVAGGTNMDFFAVNFSEVRGDLVVTGNAVGDASLLSLQFNTVRGSVVLRDNTSSLHLITVQGNAIEVNLDCSGNNPNPQGGSSPNTVGGAKLGQCAGL